jgi:hypothetical protein
MCRCVSGMFDFLHDLMLISVLWLEEPFRFVSVKDHVMVEP